MAEHRNRPRKNTPHRVNVMDITSGKTLGRVVDITANGLKLVCNSPLDPGRAFQLRITLPVMVDNKTDIEVQAEIVWCKRDNNPKFFQIGLKFTNISGDDGFLIEDVMHKFNLVG